MCLTKSPFHSSLKRFKKIFLCLNPQQAHSLLKLEWFRILLLSLPVPSLKKNLWWQSWHSRIVFIVHIRHLVKLIGQILLSLDLKSFHFSYWILAGWLKRIPPWMQSSAIYVIVISTTFYSNWLHTCMLAVHCSSSDNLQASVFIENFKIKLMTLSILPAFVIS